MAYDYAIAQGSTVEHARAAPAAIRDIIHPVLPQDSTISYLNEGAANIVYKVVVRYPTPPPSVLDSYGEGTPPPTEVEFIDHDPHLATFNNKLLRLRKDLPTTAPSVVAQESWERLIQPIFNPNEIVDQILVQLRPSNIIKRLNEELRDWEREYPLNGFLRPTDPRPTKRHGTYLADDEYGLLVTDMTSGTTGAEVVEFKPKWLVQSPSAPKNSKRCRTCALTARINSQRTRLGEPLKKSFCPLDLISSDPNDVLHVADILLQPESAPTNSMRFARWLQSTSLLQRLRDNQYIMDRKGVLEADIEDENFRVAMTLRDCTVFVIFPEDPDRDEWDVEARIGDLDLKSKDKDKYWRSVERPLIDEGWYEGTEKAKDSQPLKCSIYRHR